MNNSIAVRKDGTLASVNSSSLSISKAEMLSVGCKNCIWKLNNQCVKGYTGDKEHADGYCLELANWLFGLAGDTGSSSVLWERYHLFVSQLQAHDDYKEFKRLEEELKRYDKNTWPDNDKIQELQLRRNNLKLWWLRLTSSIISGFQKVADREARNDNVDKMTKKVMTIDDFNSIIRGEVESKEPIPVEYKKIVDGEENE